MSGAKIALISIGCRIVWKFNEEWNENLKEKLETRFYL
jgi:hypothetical protein